MSQYLNKAIDASGIVIGRIMWWFMTATEASNVE